MVFQQGISLRAGADQQGAERSGKKQQADIHGRTQMRRNDFQCALLLCNLQQALLCRFCNSSVRPCKFIHRGGAFNKLEAEQQSRRSFHVACLADEGPQ